MIYLNHWQFFFLVLNINIPVKFVLETRKKLNVKNNVIWLYDMKNNVKCSILHPQISFSSRKSLLIGSCKAVLGMDIHSEQQTRLDTRQSYGLLNRLPPWKLSVRWKVSEPCFWWRCLMWPLLCWSSTSHIQTSIDFEQLLLQFFPEQSQHVPR